MSHNDIDFQKIARQLLQNGKSKDEVITQLTNLGLEEFSARAMLDRMLSPQDMADSDSQSRLLIGLFLIIGSALSIYIVQATQRHHAYNYFAVAIGIVGICILAYGYSKR